MISASNYWLIAANWRQYFFIEFRNLPSVTIGVPPLASAIVPSGTARKASGDLRRLRPAGQTGLRVEGVLSIPTAPLRRDRGKSPRKPMFSELRTPRKLCWRHNFRPPARSRRKARTTNNPAEVCPTGRNRRRSPAAFLAVPDGKLALARGGNPDGLRR